MDVYACDHTKELIIKAHNNDKSAREELSLSGSSSRICLLEPDWQ